MIRSTGGPCYEGKSPFPLRESFSTYKWPPPHRKRGFPLSKKRYKFDGLAEFVSRRARIKLVELLRKHGMPNYEIARAVEVTERSVRYWLDPKKAHPSNEHLDRLIWLSLEINPKHAFRILNEEVEDFRRLLNKLYASSTAQIG